MVIGCFAYALVFYHRYSTSVMTKQLSEALNVSPEKINVFGSMYFWTYAVMQPIGGLLADVMEPGYLICFSTILSSIGSLIIAMSSNYVLSCFARLLVGVGCGPVYVPIGRVLANWFTPRLFNIMSAIVLSAGSCGGLLAQGPLATLIQHTHWKWGFIFPTILGVFIATLSAIFIRSRPKDYVDADVSMNEQLSPIRQLIHNFKAILRNCGFWKIVIWAALSPPTFFALTSFWGVAYITSVFGFKTEKAAYIVMMLSLSWVVGSPALASLSEALGTRKWVITGCALTASGCSLGFVFVTGGTPEWVLWALLFVFGATSSAIIGVGLTQTKETASPELAATAMGALNFFPFFMSAIVQNLLSVVIDAVDHGEHSTRAFQLGLWLPYALMLLLAGAAMATTKDTGGRAGAAALASAAPLLDAANAPL